ncbi:MAG: RNA polymerase sigma-70 factor [Carboxylicivirga sp.]|jgi:RNA polymerase sigma-70 factor (ECF subfamily)|nr:RNA polymerase sigma-70 factor [Carboxylicivirga sp.]MCT4646918.1 RNA polymerase sigma-70 factor [Carboxylicivirga sp.]
MAIYLHIVASTLNNNIFAVNTKDMKESVSNNDLIKKIKVGDESAFETLFVKYFNRLFALANSILKDDKVAQDIVQEVFVKIWEKRDVIEPGNLDAFLYKLVRNQCISHIRHLKVVENKQRNFSEIKNIEELYRIDFIRDEPYVIIEKELEQEITNVINMLPDRCREVFTLSRISGLKNKEIADQLGMNVKNVEKHITKALNVFRNHFNNRLPISIMILVMQQFN